MIYLPEYGFLSPIISMLRKILLRSCPVYVYVRVQWISQSIFEQILRLYQSPWFQKQYNTSLHWTNRLQFLSFHRLVRGDGGRIYEHLHYRHNPVIARLAEKAISYNVSRYRSSKSRKFYKTSNPYPWIINVFFRSIAS